MKRRVVISGIGAVTPLGTGKDEFWQATKNGKNGIGPITRFDPEGYKATLAAEVKDFRPEDFMPKKDSRRMDRFCQLAVAASRICMDDSGLDTDKLDEEERQRFGIYFGSGVGGLETTTINQTALLSGGNRKVSPFMIPMLIINMAPGHISMMHKLKGPALSAVTACASSTDSIGLGFRMIKDGYVDRMLVGGAEAVVTPIAVAGFSNMTALSSSTDPNRASIPFDADRNGFILGEGAGMLLIEDLDLARERGAHIYAEVLGYGSTADAYHMTAPDPEATGAIKAMSDAIREAGLSASQIDYINAHGTSTPANDKMETIAIKALFGENVKNIAVSSTKSMHGHMLGAAGAVEAITCISAINNGFVPPTINLKNPDPECDLDYTPNVGREKKIDVALSNSFGFGGQNASIVIGKYSD